jgi:hypothetical protein
MTDKTFCVIIPYIGKLPSSFNIFLDSARKNDRITFFIFSDSNDVLKYAGGNIIVNILSLEDIICRCPKDCRRGLRIPYKLCDYKPLYGELFKDYITDFEFWGYCDIDLVLGDLQSYLFGLELSRFDRLFDWGHLTFYRNVPEVNRLYRQDDSLRLGHRFVFNTTIACNYDEKGMNKLCEMKLGDRWLHELPIVDVYWWSASLKSWKKEYMNNQQLYVHYPTGKLLQYIRLESNKFICNEICYMHMMLRKIVVSENSFTFSEPYLITHKGITTFKSSQIDRYFIEYDSDAMENLNHIKMMNKMFRKRFWMKFYNEIKYMGILRGGYNVIVKLLFR